MWHDSRASLLACNLATPCLGCEPKARVVTLPIIFLNVRVETLHG